MIFHTKLQVQDTIQWHSSYCPWLASGVARKHFLKCNVLWLL